MYIHACANKWLPGETASPVSFAHLRCICSGCRLLVLGEPTETCEVGESTTAGPHSEE